MSGERCARGVVAVVCSLFSFSVASMFPLGAEARETRDERWLVGGARFARPAKGRASEQTNQRANEPTNDRRRAQRVERTTLASSECCVCAFNSAQAARQWEEAAAAKADAIRWLVARGRRFDSLLSHAAAAK